MLRLVFTFLFVVLGIGAFILLIVRMHRFAGGPRFIVRIFLLSVFLAVLASAGWLPDGCYSRDDGIVQSDGR